MGKQRVPVRGTAIGKSISTGGSGTTIQGYEGKSISLGDLQSALGIKAVIEHINSTLQPNTVGSASGGGAIVVGPGLSGGGPLVGVVPLLLTAPIPFLGDDGGGGEGDPGPPGLQGRDGATGAEGPAGPGVFLAAEDGLDGQDGIPGPVGPAGPDGGTGPVGPPYFVPAEDGEDGEPGPPGRQGVDGAQGPAGALGPAGPAIFLLGDDGAEGEPGPPGPQGAAGSGGGTTIDVPGTIADLVYWLDAGNMLLSQAGYVLPSLGNRTPWLSGYTPLLTGGSAKSSASTLNGKSLINFTGTQTYSFGAASGIDFSQGFTGFVVFNQTALQIGTFNSGSSGALQFRMDASGHLALVKAGVAAIANSTAAIAAATWFQGNATYQSSTGAYAFRMGRAASGSGTVSEPITAVSWGLGYNPAAGGECLNGLLAELIVYCRVLSSAEITSVENYLNSKWGV